MLVVGSRFAMLMTDGEQGNGMGKAIYLVHVWPGIAFRIPNDAGGFMSFGIFSRAAFMFDNRPFGRYIGFLYTLN